MRRKYFLESKYVAHNCYNAERALSYPYLIPTGSRLKAVFGYLYPFANSLSNRISNR